jgi:D-alanyl-D-alanine carboxypeptidase (penicillin-binding protein 5/6)
MGMVGITDISSKGMKKIACLPLFSCLLLLAALFSFPTQALAQGNQGDVTRSQGAFIVDTIGELVEREDEIRAGLLYDAERGVVVWEKNMYSAYPIASLTKMMVALLAVEDVRAGKVSWSDEVTVVQGDQKSRRRRRAARNTDTYTLEALIQLAMIPSNNRACVNIATYLDGSLEAFVKRMNDKAQALGMMSTFYANPSGLPGIAKDLDNSSSPHDLLLLALELIKFEEILKITSMGSVEISNGKHTGVFRNHNHLVVDYETAVDGLKTGYTRRAKYCLVATAKKEGHRLISVVLGVDGPAQRNAIVASMLNKYYEQINMGPMLPTTSQTVWTKQRQLHTVRRGETLITIAKQYKVTYKQVKEWNGLRSNTILPGQKLYIYVSIPNQAAIENADVRHTEDKTATKDDGGRLRTVEHSDHPTPVSEAETVVETDQKAGG